MIKRMATLGGILAAGLFWASAGIGLGLGHHQLLWGDAGIFR